MTSTTDSLEHDVALSIHAFYVGELDAGRRASDRILARDDLSPQTELMARANRCWYSRLLAELCPCVMLRQIDVAPAHDGWSTFNPSLLWHDGRLLCLVRSSNYRIVQGRYVMPPGDPKIRTHNILCEIDPVTLASTGRRVIDGPAYPSTDYEITGLEDCRLRHTATGVGVSCTVRDVAPFDGRCRIATADLDVDAATMTNLTVLDSLSTQDHEKNWMPIEGRGGWLYSCRHMGRVVTVDDDPSLPGGHLMHARQPTPPIARGFRGGGQLVPAEGGYLGVIHECAHIGHQRAYEHRFVWFDNDLQLLRMSPPFAFRELRAIEFAAGLAVVDGMVYVSFGHKDETAWIASLSLQSLWRAMSPA